MDSELKNALYVRYTRSCRPQHFASLAKPKASELNMLRHRHLAGIKEVIWDIAKKTTEKRPTISKWRAFMPPR